MIRTWYELWSAHRLRLWLLLPFLDFNQGPKLPVERGDALPGSGDVYVDNGLRMDPGDGSVLVCKRQHEFVGFRHFQYDLYTRRPADDASPRIQTRIRCPRPSGIPWTGRSRSPWAKAPGQRPTIPYRARRRTSCCNRP